MASEMGARLILTARDESRLHETLNLLQGQGHAAHSLDLLVNTDFPKWVERLETLSGVVHAAGVVNISPFRMLTETHLHQMMQVNFNAPLLLTQNLLKSKKIQAGASLVFITAVADHISPVGSAVYSASKAALTSAVRSLALETAKFKIRANCVSPGYVTTPMMERLSTSTSINELKKLSHLGEIQAEDVAASVIYLLSDAARWVTRSRLVVDGGLSLPVR
jgi:NAD(P)-dependent dehydrogenase (short-subunit alcohol dehydrogenase family)